MNNSFKKLIGLLLNQNISFYFIKDSNTLYSNTKNKEGESIWACRPIPDTEDELFFIDEWPAFFKNGEMAIVNLIKDTEQKYCIDIK